MGSRYWVRDRADHTTYLNPTHHKVWQQCWVTVRACPEGEVLPSPSILLRPLTLGEIDGRTRPLCPATRSQQDVGPLEGPPQLETPTHPLQPVTRGGECYNTNDQQNRQTRGTNSCYRITRAPELRMRHFAH